MIDLADLSCTLTHITHYGVRRERLLLVEMMVPVLLCAHSVSPCTMQLCIMCHQRAVLKPLNVFKSLHYRFFVQFGYFLVISSGIISL